MLAHKSISIEKGLFTMRKLFALFAISTLSFCAAAAMTGQPRKNFIDSFTKSCLRTQSDASINSGASSRIIRKYCNCSALYIADLVNNDLVSEIERGNIKFNPQWAEMSANYCRINFEKY